MGARGYEPKLNLQLAPQYGLCVMHVFTVINMFRVLRITQIRWHGPWMYPCSGAWYNIQEFDRTAKITHFVILIGRRRHPYTPDTSGHSSDESHSRLIGDSTDSPQDRQDWVERQRHQASACDQQNLTIYAKGSPIVIAENVVINSGQSKFTSRN